MKENSIALIDDDEIFLMLTSKLLEKKLHGYFIQSFSNSKKAFNFLTTETSEIEELPKIIFLDIVMPDFNGWQFLQEFEKNRNPTYQPHIFIMSGNDNVDYQRIKMFPLISGYLVKPVVPDKLISMIKSLSVN